MPRPTQIRQGDQYEWTESSSDYPATTYTGKAYVNGASALTVTAVADGAGYDFTITSAQSAALTPGKYQLQVRVENGSTYYTLSNTVIDVVAGGVQAAGYDPRSTAQQQLDAVSNIILAILASPNQEATSGGKSYTQKDLTQLYQLQKKLQYDVRADSPGGKRLLTEFRKPA